MTRSCFGDIARLLTSMLLVLSLATPLQSTADAAAPSAVEPQPMAEAQPAATEAQPLQEIIEDYAESESHAGMGLLVAVVSVTFIFGGPVLILSLLITQHYRSQKRLAEFRRECVGKLIDAGKDVPEALLFFDDLGRDQSPGRDLSRGIKNVALGVGVGIFLGAVIDPQAGTFGLILVALGGAQLLSWKLTAKAA